MGSLKPPPTRFDLSPAGTDTVHGVDPTTSTSIHVEAARFSTVMAGLEVYART